MAIMSSLVTAKTNLDGYNTTVPSTVNADDVDVSNDAKKTYNAIVNDYNNIKNQFNALASQLSDAQSKVKGSKLKTSIKKASGRVSDQATYCEARRKDLDNAFEFALLEGKVKDLEEKYEAIVNAQNNNG